MCYFVSGRFDLVLGEGASWEREAPGIQRSILELRLDKFPALEVFETIFCLRFKSEMLLHVRWVLGGWVVFPSSRPSLDERVV